MERFWLRAAPGRRAGLTDETPVVTLAPPAPLGSAVALAASAIRIRNLVKRYGSIEAVRGIGFDVNEGEIFGLIGPDGAGKTSTFQIAAGVMESTSGGLAIFGIPARGARAQTGYLTQNFSLYPDLTVNENIRYIGDLRRVPREDIVARGQRYLRMFDMDRFSARLAGQLSGGMKQKLALACALVPEPRVLLLDEPTTGVDPVSRRNSPGNLQTCILVSARAKNDLELRIILFKETLQMRFKIRFQTVQRLEQANCWGECARQHGTPALSQAHRARRHQEGIHRRGDDANNAEQE